MAYGALNTRQRMAASITGLQGLGQYGPYDTDNENGYGPAPTAAPGTTPQIPLGPDEGNWWTPKASVVPPPGINPLLVLGLLVGGAFFYGMGKHA